MAKILIIDDDADITESMRVVLEDKKHEVISALSGSEGIKKAEENKPDMIILDVMMETADRGFEVAREIKKDKNLKNIPILMLTAIKEKAGMDFNAEAGDKEWLPVDGYLDKPIGPAELISKVNSFLNNK